ncbi:asparagine synthase-related protein [Virgibacillus kimchii]
MSDFIYSKIKIDKGKLTKEVQKIYHDDKPTVEEFHGEWGSLAVSTNLYNGFQYYESNDFIFVVIGGPILRFQDNKFFKKNTGNTGTKAIFNKWIKEVIKWDEDLSGPYTILIINKKSSDVQCITDLMSFIPVYIYQDSTNIMLSTHVDILAETSNQKDNIDMVSTVDFILHSVVTFPYTVYNGIFQIKPASIHYFNSHNCTFHSQAYWIPEEKFEYKSIKQAADNLRKSLTAYINSIISETSDVAQFISGGEDSRVLSALLQKKSRDAFIFLDQMNTEGKIAKKTAKAYGADFNLKTRTKTHYLEILSDCSSLVGSGSQYLNAHTYGFHKSCNLNDYSAIFGGLLSDGLLKGSHIKKLRGSGRLPFIPDIRRRGYSAGDFMKNNLITPDILEELTRRRQSHLNYVKNFRNESAEEWFELWPSSMNVDIGNLHANRRLFRSFEPFMANDVVKLSTSVPQKWKLNRKLFHKAAKPLLKPTKWLLHGDGRLPYFVWYINIFIQLTFWSSRKFGKGMGLIKGNQGSWADWNALIKSQEWKKSIDNYSDEFHIISSAFIEKDVNKIFENSNLKPKQKINLLQTLYNIKF